MNLDDGDWKLSMRVSPRAKRAVHDVGLRSLLVHRFSDTLKLILRRSLRADQVGWFCEGCDAWVHNDTVPPDVFANRLRCPRCARTYRLEFAVYEEIDPGEDE